MKQKSIRFYLFLSMATVLVCSTLAMALIQTIIATNYFRAEKEGLMDQIVAAVYDGVRTGQTSLSDGPAQSISYISHVTGASIYIADPYGRVQYSGGPILLQPEAQISMGILQTLHQEGAYTALGNLDGLLPGNHFIAARALHDYNNELLGFAFAATDSTSMQVYLFDTLSGFALGALCVLLLALAFSMLITNQLLVPVQRLGDAARHFAEGDYSTRVKVDGKNELSRLGLNFNEMAEAIQAANQNQRSFMGNIAHELRTPMTSIKGFIDGMLDGTIPPEQRDKYLGIVSGEVGRLARLTQNMLDVSRLEAGEYTLTISNFNLSDLVTRVFLGAERRLEAKNLVVSGLLGGPSVYVRADEDFTYQVVYNLLDNAIKFVDDGGSITVEMEPVRDYVQVGIRNSGISLPPAALPTVFERFYKTDQSRGINAHGAGLGLHIVRVLVGLMGGRIWAESAAALREAEGATAGGTAQNTVTDEEWTTFYFTLPLGTAPVREWRMYEDHEED